jgi:hypothetical protein
VTLKWTPVKSALTGDEFYQVTLSFKHQGALWYDYQTLQGTEWTASEHRYLLDIADPPGEFTWSVKLIHKTGEKGGVPVGNDLSASSSPRRLLWRKAGAGQSVTAGPTTYP